MRGRGLSLGLFSRGSKKDDTGALTQECAGRSYRQGRSTRRRMHLAERPKRWHAVAVIHHTSN